MATVQINLQDDLQERLEIRATEGGYKSVEEYIETLLRADCEEEDEVDEELEALLLQRLDDPSKVELTPEYIKEFDERVARRRQAEGLAG